jgi:endonuclease/exonuclease/phosphatase (EEP) superfamily protein YafD
VPDSPVMKVFGDTLMPVEKSEPRMTCPAGEPKVEIDHFFLRGLKAASAVTVLPEAMASDHRPLVVTVQIGEGK